MEETGIPTQGIFAVSDSGEGFPACLGSEMESKVDAILERWESALKIIRKAGYLVREEWLDGASGGLCEFGGKKYFFSDQSLSLFERLDQAEEAAREIVKEIEKDSGKKTA